MTQPEDLILPTGLTVGGYFLLNDLLGTGKDDETDYYKGVMQSAAAAIGQEVRSEEVKDEVLKQHIATFKGRAISINKQLDQGLSQDLDKFEKDIEGKPLEERSMDWKLKADELASLGVGDVSGESGLQRSIEDITGLIPYYGPLSKALSLLGAGALAKRLIDFGWGGGGSGGLPRTIGGWINENLLPNYEYADGYDEDPDPEEEPSSDTGTQPQVEGSPRAAAQRTGIALELAAELAAYTSTPVASTITLGQESLNSIADATGVGVDWLVNNPGKAIIMALVIVGAVALATADGPALVGDAAGATLLKTTAAALGVSLPSMAVAKNVAPKIAV